MVKLHLVTTPQVMRLLRRLAKTGMFRGTVAEVAEELLRTKIREDIAKARAAGLLRRNRR